MKKDTYDFDFVYTTDDGRQIVIAPSDMEAARKRHNVRMKEYLDSLTSDKSGTEDNA